MKKTISVLILVILPFTDVFAQVPASIPAILNPNTATPTMSEVYAKFDSLMLNTDSTLKYEKIMAQRWMKYDLPKYNIEDDTIFNNKPYNDALKAFYQGDFLCTNDPNSDWEQDGPLTPSFSFTSPDQPFRGWIDAVCINKDVPQEMLIATRTSGFFKTIDNGLTWNCVTDGLTFPVLGCHTMISLPSQPEWVVAITGIGGIDGGVMYSSDFGENWTKAAQNLPTFKWIDYHPSNSNLLFACSNENLYYSFDKGVTWTIAGAPADLDFSLNHMFEVFVRENTVALVSRKRWGERAFIHNFNFVLSGNSISSSSWTAKLNYQFELGGTDELEFIDFSNKVGNYHYIQVNSTSSSSQGKRTYKTINGGITYNEVTTVNIPISGWFKNEIIVSPNNPNVVYWGAVSLSETKRYNTTTGASTSILQHPTNAGHHDDYRSSHILSLLGKDVIAIGHDGGLGIIPDGLNSIPQIQGANGNLSVNLIHCFDLHERTGRTVFNYQDGPMFYKNIDGTFSSEFLWEGSVAMVQKQSQDALVGSIAGSLGGIYDKTGSPHPIINHNGQINNTFGSGAVYLGAPFITYRHFPNRFASGLNYGLIGMNRDVMVSEMSQITNNDSPVSAVAICEKKPQYIYAASQDQQLNYWGGFKFCKSIDDGLNWTPVNEFAQVEINGNSTNLHQALDYNFIKCLAVDPEDEMVLYAGIAGTRVDYNGQFVDEEFRVIKSINGGDHFVDYSEGLPALPIDELLTVESDNDLIFCANAVGIFYRTNTMTQWECFSNNLPKVEITTLKYDYCNNMLYASTYGRGLWKTNVGFDVPNSYVEEITTNTIWNEDRVQGDHVVVKAGNTLTITCKVEFYRNKTLTVEPGAKLNLAGAYLTSYCNDYWNGIEVLGNDAQPQNSQYQGKVSVHNSTIENAREAIMPWRYNDWSKTGGIIQATSSTFRNNKRSIQYMAYQNIHPTTGAEQNNIGYFTDCTFEWTNDFFEVQPQPAITMNGVKGVTISGCTFQDLRTNITDVHNRGRGIFTIDAGYTVKGRSLLLAPPIHDYFDPTDYKVCEFINLYKGVENLSGAGAYPFLVDHCSFLNCQEGVTVNGVDNTLITRNAFNHNFTCPLDIQYAYNLNLVSSSGFNVQGNVFNNDLGLPNLGVNATYTGTAENEIYKNKFFDQRTANGAFGRNGNDEFVFENLSKGLQFMCNENTGNLNDMSVTALSTSNDQGVRLFQGSVGEATLNELTQNLQPGGFHFTTNDQQNLKYYWKGANGQPTNTNGNFTDVFEPNDEGCPSDFSGGVIMLHENGVLANGVNVSLNNELSSIKTEYEDLYDVFSNNLLAGDASSLHTQVANLTIANRLSVKQSLLNESPYLSIDLLTALGQKPSTLFPHEWLQELIEANIEVYQDYTFRTFLSTKSDPMPTVLLTSLDTYSKNNVSQRGLDMAEIGERTSRMAEIENVLIADLSFSADVDDQTDLPNYIENRDNYVKRAELIDYYLGIGNISEANNQIVLLQQELPTMTYTALNEELEDFVALKEYVIQHLNSANTLNAELTLDEINFFTNARDNYTGRAAYQASNILCFYANMCEEYDPMELATIGRGQGESSEQKETIVVREEKGDFILYPNPNQGAFVLKGINNSEIKRIDILDLQGKSMPFKVIRINEHTSQVDFVTAKRGMYIVRIWNVNGEKQNIRILKN